MESGEFDVNEQGAQDRTAIHRFVVKFETHSCWYAPVHCEQFCVVSIECAMQWSEELGLFVVPVGKK